MDDWIASPDGTALVRGDGVSIVPDAEQSGTFAIRKPLPAHLDDVPTVHVLWHTATDLKSCPCCDKPFATQRAARLVADALYPRKEAEPHEPAPQTR